MSIVVEQTIPFPSSTLNLSNPSRWTTLFPLIRPSLKAVPTTKSNSATILVDTDLLNNSKRALHIAAISTLGNLSSKLLDERGIAVIATESAGEGVSDEDVVEAIRSAAGGDVGSGVVVVRVGKQSKVQVKNESVISVQTKGEVEFDHVLHLLAHAKGEVRGSAGKTAEVLEAFGKEVRTAGARFHTEKEGGKAAVSREGGVLGYEKAREVVELELDGLLKGRGQSAGETLSVHYADVNGLSRLENYIVAGEIARYLDSKNLSYHISHSTILDHANNARGIMTSICPIPAAYLPAQSKPQPHQPTPTTDDTALQKILSPSNARNTFDDAQVRRHITSACNAVIKAEPTITEYDTIVGDGDCGYTLRDGAKQVLAFIEGKDLARLPETVAALVHDLEVNMGGTSGALYCIYLTALASALATEASVSKALDAALQQLLKYTRARLGDRTMMDALIPFIETLNASGDVSKAIEETRKGVEGTKKMEAKLGRSTYLDESATQGVPDPGAYGLLVLLEGMSKV